MRLNTRLLLTSSAALLFAAVASAQSPAPDSAPTPPPPMHGPRFGPGPGGPGPFAMELLGFGGMHGGKVVTGAPFTATAVGESDRTLADGTKISHKVQSNLYRDAQGRFRREVTVPAIGPFAANANGDTKSLVVISDPVAGANFVLEPDKKVARKMPQGAGKNWKKGNPDDAPDALHGPGGPNANITKESLGTQTINGVSAEGTRYTRTIPAGKIGNDKPLVIVKEEWYSPDLQVVVQSKRIDPFVGITTYNVTNIQRTAPSASLFTVPPDYSVKDAPERMGKRGFHRKGEMTPPPPDATGPGMEM